MKRITLLIFTISAIAASAQNADTRQKKQTQQIDISSAEAMAESLEIAPQEAEKVWALYQEHEDQNRKMKEAKIAEVREARSSGNELSDQDLESRQRQLFDFQRSKIDAEEQYYNSLLKIVPASKANMVLKADRQSEKAEMQSKKARMQGAGRAH